MAYAVDTSKRTNAEIRNEWQRLKPSYRGDPFVVAPQITAPHAPGSLADGHAVDALGTINFARYLAGLPADVTLDAKLNETSQYGAVLLATSDFSHTPKQPAGMSKEFYERGYDSTSKSNIGWASSSSYTVADFERLCLADADPNNVQVVGHRRWLLNPAMQKTGVGYARNNSVGKGFFTTYALNVSRTQAVDYDYIAWPSAGPFPKEFLTSSTPWSITLNPARYRWGKSGHTVTLVRVSDGSSWSFNANDTTAAGKEFNAKYFSADFGGYGIANAFIFRPHPAVTYAPGDEFVVTLSGGIYEKDTGKPTTVSYATRIMSLEGVDGVKLDIAAPTSRSDAVATYISVPATITITATAEAGGSGVAALYYRIDGGTTQTVIPAGNLPAYTVTKTVALSKKGTRTLEFWAADNAGNVESPRNVVTFKIISTSNPGSDDMPITMTVKDRHSKGAHGAEGYSASDIVSCIECHSTKGYTGCTHAGCHRVATTRDLMPGEGAPANHAYLTDYDCGDCHGIKDDLPPKGTIERISGADRFTTAIEVSKANFTSADAVIIATGMNYADALSASALAGSEKVPLLLTGSDALSPGVLQEVKRLGATKAYIMGSTAAVSDAVGGSLLGAKLQVERIAGADRYQTSAAIAQKIAALEGRSFAKSAFLARGDNFADGLAVSPLAYKSKIPVILTRPTELSVPAAGAIQGLGITDVTILGSDAAVAGSVEAAVKGLSTSPTVRRVAGADRYRTAQEIAKRTLDNSSDTEGFIGVATGLNFPDALAGGVAAGERGGILVLTAPEALSVNWASYLPGAYRGAKSDIQVYGGSSAVSDNAMDALRDLLLH
ncbi:MAG: cell wall-binding repeat-containing protein [Coriobacteriia bacterium]|nr:cell wall-binding repeat-containing protein [Coriobacteriia bacterium]